jgi:hypothetical protein
LRIWAELAHYQVEARQCKAWGFRHDRGGIRKRTGLKTSQLSKFDRHDHGGRHAPEAATRNGRASLAFTDDKIVGATQELLFYRVSATIVAEFASAWIENKTVTGI